MAWLRLNMTEAELEKTPNASQNKILSEALQGGPNLILNKYKKYQYRPEIVWDDKNELILSKNEPISLHFTELYKCKFPKTLLCTINQN